MRLTVNPKMQQYQLTMAAMNMTANSRKHQEHQATTNTEQQSDSKCSWGDKDAAHPQAQPYQKHCYQKPLLCTVTPMVR